MEEASLFTKKEKTPEEIVAEEKNPLIQGKCVIGKHSGKTGYLIRMDSPQSGVEANYFWILRQLKAAGPHFGLGFTDEDGRVEKIQDIYTAGEASAYWGTIETRRGIQQEKISNLLATIGKLIKDTFQMTRELRIIDERTEFYKKGSEGDLSSEISLKGTWIDMVEGGIKNPASVYGLARELGFVTLPDLFFKICPKKADDVDKEVAKLEKEGINRKVREVLARKLKQYMVWREKTHKEISQRRNFMLKYLRQHFNVIKMYMNWIRPYLRNIRALSMKGTLTDEDIVSAFETSKIELELLAIKNKYTLVTKEGYEEIQDFKKYKPCLSVKIKFVALPEMAFIKEQQRGPIHMGRTEITVQGYVATEDQIEQYKKHREEADFELLSTIEPELISSLEESMLALKDDLFKYLEEAGELTVKKEPEKEERESAFAPFKALADGFREIFGAKKKEKEEPKEKKVIRLSATQEKDEKAAAKAEAANVSWILYDVFKKAHGMITP